MGKKRPRHKNQKAAEDIYTQMYSDMDGTFAFIAGYTPGGAPYGITWPMALKFTSNELVEIGRRVQDARVAKRMTQEYVADQCDCTTKHISDIERGVVGPSFPVIAKMGKLFDTGVDYYLYNTAGYVSDRMITADISEALVNCDTDTRMYCREMNRGPLHMSEKSATWLMDESFRLAGIYASVVSELLEALYRTRDYAGVRDYATKAIQMDPMNLQAHYWLTASLVKSRNRGLAKQALAKAKEMLGEDDYADVLYQLGNQNIKLE